jgi:hypothetical protein
VPAGGDPESKAGRKPWDAIVMFKAIVLCELYNLMLQSGAIDEIQDRNHGELHPKRADFVSEGVRFIMAKDISEGRVNFLTCYRIHWKQYVRLRASFARGGDSLLSHKEAIGNSAYVGQPCDTNTASYLLANRLNISTLFCFFANLFPVFFFPADAEGSGTPANALQRRRLAGCGNSARFGPISVFVV